METVSAGNPKFDGKVPHLMCRQGDVAKIVLLPGDPARVALFKELCTDFEIVSSNREYTVGTGYYHGTQVSVCSTGIGAPSTEIAIIELIELGAKALIRIGGTGVIRPDIKCGDMIINTAAMRLGGSSCFYAPPEYPAVASFEVINSLIEACEDSGIDYWTGISASIGSFFAGQARPAAGKSFHDKDLLKRYERLNILNLEMESETIMTLGSIFGILTGSLCAVHANRATDKWLCDFSEAQKTMCTIALNACTKIEKKYLKNSTASCL